MAAGAAQQLGNPRADFHLQLRQGHEMMRRFLHGVYHFRRHDRTTQNRNYADAINDWADAEPRVDVRIRQCRPGRR